MKIGKIPKVVVLAWALLATPALSRGASPVAAAPLAGSVVTPANSQTPAAGIFPGLTFSPEPKNLAEFADKTIAFINEKLRQNPERYMPFVWQDWGLAVKGLDLNTLAINRPPLATYRLRFREIVDGQGLTAAEADNADTYFVETAGVAIWAIEEPTDASGQVNYNPDNPGNPGDYADWEEDVLPALDKLPTLAPVQKGSYEARLLIINDYPPDFGSNQAIWLKSNSGDADYLYLLHPVNRRLLATGLQADRLYSSGDFLQVIQSHFAWEEEWPCIVSTVLAGFLICIARRTAQVPDRATQAYWAAFGVGLWPLWPFMSDTEGVIYPQMLVLLATGFILRVIPRTRNVGHGLLEGVLIAIILGVVMAFFPTIN